LWSQTADRTVTTRIHAHPFWWYFPFLPLFIFPWVAWPRFWQSVRHLPWKSDAGIRLCSVWFISCLLIFSLIQSKQVHYLVPLLPAFSLLLSRLMVSSESQQRLRYEWVLPICFTMIGLFLMCMPYMSTFAKLAWVQAMDFTWGASVLIIGVVLFTLTLYLRRLSILAVSTSVVLAIFIGFVCFFQYTGLAYNLKPAAEKVKYFQAHHIPVAYVGNYQGQFQFLGRLTQAIEVIPPDESLNWTTAHPAGYLISLEKKADNNTSYSQRQRERWLIFRTAEQVRGS